MKIKIENKIIKICDYENSIKWEVYALVWRAKRYNHHHRKSRVWKHILQLIFRVTSNHPLCLGAIRALQCKYIQSFKAIWLLSYFKDILQRKMQERKMRKRRKELGLFSIIPNQIIQLNVSSDLSHFVCSIKQFSY